MANKTYDPDMLFEYYRKHNGSQVDTANDPDCPINSRQAIARYAEKYDWDNKLQQIVTAKQRQANDKRLELAETIHTRGYELLVLALNSMIGKTIKADGKEKQYFAGDVGDVEKAIKLALIAKRLPTNYTAQGIIMKDDDDSDFTIDDVKRLIQRAEDGESRLFEGEGEGEE